MAQSQCCHGITHNVLLLTAHLAATLTSAKLLSIRCKSGLSSHLVNDQISHWSRAILSAAFLKQCLHISHRLKVKLGPFHVHLLEDHVVLGKRAGLVSEQELDASQFLRNGGVARNSVRHLFVFVDQVRVVDLCQVEVDAERDRNDGRKQ